MPWLRCARGIKRLIGPVRYTFTLSFGISLMLVFGSDSLWEGEITHVMFCLLCLINIESLSLLSLLVPFPVL